MFSEIDNTIFPDSCEVLEIVPSQLFVYPIFKNGSSTLRKIPDTRKYVDLEIQHISKPITIFLRDPKERFISGVNTFVQQCQRDYSELDTKTILFFVKNYFFLNRHYSPQFFWLLNLARYSQAPLVFNHMNDIAELTSINSRAGIAPLTEQFLDSIKDFPWDKLELYFFLDQILFNWIGQETTFTKIVEDIKTHHYELYDLIFQKTYNILNALPKT